MKPHIKSFKAEFMKVQRSNLTGFELLLVGCGSGHRNIARGFSTGRADRKGGLCRLSWARNRPGCPGWGLFTRARAW